MGGYHGKKTISGRLKKKKRINTRSKKMEAAKGRTVTGGIRERKYWTNGRSLRFCFKTGFIKFLTSDLCAITERLRNEDDSNMQPG